MRLLVAVVVMGLAVGAARAAEPAQRFVVFFQEWSAALDESAQGVIGQAASWAKAHPGGSVGVTGFADPTGSRKANILLSELRAQVVVDQLQADGVNPKRMREVGVGSVRFVSTSQESRRVEISIPSR